MSELRQALSSRQLLKHHELIQFLTQHPNVKRTLAELDYLLPTGASLQRFPPEWLELMRSGHCGNRNIEVILPGEEEDDDDDKEVEEGRSGEIRAVAQTSLDPNTVLICRQPAITAISELASLLESAASTPDPESSPALHTAQVRLPEAILREAQRRGLAYYFSEALQAKAAASIARGGGGATGMGGAEKGDALLNAATTGGAGVPSVVVRLPPGVRLRYRLLTHRGIMVQDEHCLPVRLHLGERLQITLDDENAARHAAVRGLGTNGLPRASHLDVSFGFVSSVVRLQKEVEENPPLRLSVKHTPASGAVTAPSASGPAREGRFPFTRIQVSAEAVRAERFRLILRVRSRRRPSQTDAAAEAEAEGEATESFLEYDIRDVDVRQPGVLIGREREPSSFTLPREYTLADPAVHGRSVVDPAADEAPARAARVLPWWQSGAPSCSLVRDITFPLEESVKAATDIVFTRRALSHESKLRAAKKLMKLRQEQQRAAAGDKDRAARHSVRANQHLRNRHLIHFGLDASVPFTVRKK